MCSLCRRFGLRGNTRRTIGRVKSSTLIRRMSKRLLIFFFCICICICICCVTVTRNGVTVRRNFLRLPPCTKLGHSLRGGVVLVPVLEEVQNDESTINPHQTAAPKLGRSTLGVCRTKSF